MDSLTAQAVLLGVLQGLTEFLPVSSSGHLALCQQLLPGFTQPGLLLDVMLHVGTLVAVIAYFRRELREILIACVSAMRGGRAGEDAEALKLVVGIATASVPTVLIGILLEARAERLFESMAGVGIALLVTAAVLVAGEVIGRKTDEKTGNPGIVNSFIIGIAQGIAVIPGISRSGATISTARALGVGRDEAARFSFIASLPVVTGAAAYSVVRNWSAVTGFTTEQVWAYLAGPAMAMVVGYAAIEVVMRMIRNRTFHWFAVYCFVLGMVSIIASYYT